jgi:hypothetical protein
MASTVPAEKEAARKLTVVVGLAFTDSDGPAFDQAARIAQRVPSCPSFTSSTKSYRLRGRVSSSGAFVCTSTRSLPSRAAWGASRWASICARATPRVRSSSLRPAHVFSYQREQPFASHDSEVIPTGIGF